MIRSLRRGRDLPVGMTAANWRMHPHAPWAFANVACFLPTARVGKGRQRRLPQGEPLPSLLFEDERGEAVSLPRFLHQTHADGFLVLHRGAVMYEHYAAHTSAASRHLAFSITKAVVGLLAELLIAAGKLDAHSRAGALAPALAGTAFANACLRDLLDMRDGVPFDENYADPDAQIHRYSRHFWGGGRGGVLAGLRALSSASALDGAFAYRTPVTDVIGLMIERATGQSLPDLTAARIWGPAGAACAARWVLDTAGRPIASAGFSCTLRDLARLGLAMAEGARGFGPLRAARSIFAGGDRARFAAASMATRPGYSYRSGWWVDHPAGALNALGVFGQRLHIVPGDEIVIARFGSHPVASNEATDIAHARAFAAIGAALRGG